MMERSGVCVCTGGGIAGVLCSLAQAEAAGFGPKYKTEPLGLGLGSAVGNGSGGRWEEVVGCGVCGGCGGLCGRSTAQAGGRCLGLTTRNRAAVTRFRVFHVKKRWWQVAGGSGVVRTRRRQPRAFTNAKRGRGLGPKTQNRAAVARFRICHVKRRWRKVVGGGGVARTMQSRSRACAFANTRGGSGLGAKNLKPSAMARFWAAFRH